MSSLLFANICFLVMNFLFALWGSNPFRQLNILGVALGGMAVGMGLAGLKVS